jgi:membrane associated rhomboid family serine protease
VIPISDQKRIGKIPFLTIALISLNVIIFFITFSNLRFFVQKYGFVPGEIEEGRKFFTFLSSLFLHANLSHLVGNIWFLWIFGDNVEAKLGRIKFLILYFLSGFGSLIFFFLTASQRNIPLVGASGAISGILGAYFVLFPKNKIKALVPVFYFYKIVSIPAVIYIGIWFFYQLLYIPTESFVAYWAHVGGFLTGILLTEVLRK